MADQCQVLRTATAEVNTTAITFPLRLCFGLFGSKAALPMARIQIGRICSGFHLGFGQDDWRNLRIFQDHIKIGPPFSFYL